MRGQIVKGRRRERGVTIVITAVALVVMLAMAALAIDVVTLYVASGEAQKNADAAALAGAKAFVSSGFTSWQLGDPTTGAAQAKVCNGTTGLADYQAQAAAQKNLIAGTVPTTVTTTCTFPTGGNPQITVKVTRTGLPTFFARIWSTAASSVSATANAEAYNPSGSTTVPIHVHSVKPWLIPNCSPGTTPPCTGAPYYVNAATNYALNNPAAYIGQFFPAPLTQHQAGQPSVAGEYYALDLTPQATDCPASTAAPPGSCSKLGVTAYHDNIACANTALTLSCGDTVNVLSTTGSVAARNNTEDGIQCLIHTTDKGNNPPTSCTLDLDPDCFVRPAVAGSGPVIINGGASNPNPAMRVANVSRSDSVVTVPIFDYQTAANNPCPPAGVCGAATVVGFLQLGIQSVSLPPPKGTIGAVVLNASGCDPASAGNPAVSGGGVSPVPVRLTQ
jgi:hypothetical protein